MNYSNGAFRRGKDGTGIIPIFDFTAPTDNTGQSASANIAVIPCLGVDRQKLPYVQALTSDGNWPLSDCLLLVSGGAKQTDLAPVIAERDSAEKLGAVLEPLRKGRQPAVIDPVLLKKINR